MTDLSAADIIIVGAGSAGCTLAARLHRLGHRRILVLEAGPSHKHPLITVPFGLIWAMGSKRDWRFSSTPQVGADGRVLKVPRGKVVGGSGGINSMVWFRGCRADFDDWSVEGWGAQDVWPVFEALEDVIKPAALPDPHPLSQALGDVFAGQGVPDPEVQSAGVFRVNMRKGRRHSAADAFLAPVLRTGQVQLRDRAQVARLLIEKGRAVGVVLEDGRKLWARHGVVLSAGAIESPALLMRSGIGPGDVVRRAGVEVVREAPEVGANLHDHPAIGLHHAGPGSGYGLVPAQLPAWAAAPLVYMARGKGRLSSNSVEAGAFLRSDGGAGAPDVQVHFIPFHMGHKGRAITAGAGYFADVCVMRPRSRGRLTIDGAGAPQIDLGLFADARDMEVLVGGFRALRGLMAQVPFGPRGAPEVYPAAEAQTDAQIAAHIRARCGTAYHPVGTLALGRAVDKGLAVAGVQALWVADASVMPQVTSANTNAPSMMIGYHGAGMISEQLRERP